MERICPAWTRKYDATWMAVRHEGGGDDYRSVLEAMLRER
jgi:hypothetical protein